MSQSAIQELIYRNRWTVANGEADDGPFVLRYREPILGPGQIAGYGHCLRVVWGYAEVDSGELPDAATTARLNKFEAAMLSVLEQDAVAVLTAVLTFDGARQWVFYTRDLARSAQHVGDVCSAEDAQDLEVDAFDDPTWNYLREQILFRVHGRVS
jgi:hypothetical protein